MEFQDDLRRFSDRAKTMIPHLQTEEATKHSLILPFLQLLGYNVFDPNEVIPEYTADIGTKKGEKVDYAILKAGRPVILIEAKAVGDNLVGHGTQLFRYFTTTPAKFAILTNGIIYRFFSDLQEPNKLDDQPFLEFNLLDLRDSVVAEVRKFHKDNFNADDLFSAAANLKYATAIRTMFDAELKEPSDDFLRFWLREAYSGKVTHSVLEKFRPIVKKALNLYLNEMVNDRLKSALQTTAEAEKEAANHAAGQQAEPVEENGQEQKKMVVTSMEELEGFYVVKSLVREFVDPARVSYKDTINYFAVLVDGNVRKWICRLYLNGAKKSITLPNEDKSERSLEISGVDDLFKYRDEIATVAKRIVSSDK